MTTPATHTSDLPPFYCPIPPAVHPKANILEQRASAWLDEHHVYPDPTERAWGMATHSIDFVCRLAPDGHDERVLLFALWNYWAFAIDDEHDDESTALSVADAVDIGWRVIRTLEVPGYRPLGTHRLADGLTDLVERTRAVTSAAQLHRFAAGLRDVLYAMAWQLATIERGIVPTLDDYAAVRPSLIGARFSIAWIEIANDVRLSADQWARDDIQALIDAAGFVVSCHNDMLGAAKEDHRRVPEINIITVLRHHNRCSTRQAIADTVAIQERVTTLFLTLRKQLATDPDSEVRRFAAATGHYIRGNLDWHIAAPRYASPRNRNAWPVPNARCDAEVTDRPSDPNTAPPAIASIDWWWHHILTA
jgi:hypothetical protein